METITMTKLTFALSHLALFAVYGLTIRTMHARRNLTEGAIHTLSMDLTHAQLCLDYVHNVNPGMFDRACESADSRLCDDGRVVPF